MRGISLCLAIVLLFSFQGMADAHSGRTDSEGGHNCSAKSKAKGLCTGYHYHNGGDSSSGSPSTSDQSWDKDCTDFASYEEAVEHWNSKGYTKYNDPERLDGWGNKVDDGIPCEPPDGYDTAKINGSPKQVAQQTAKQEKAKGEKAGHAVGVKDGYQGKEKNPAPSSGSDAYVEGYKKGYTKGYEEGRNKINVEKEEAEKAGYALGKKQDSIEIPSKYSKKEVLKLAFKSAFKRAVAERVKESEDEFSAIGYKDGKHDNYNEPINEKENYIDAYKKGFEKGQKDLKKSYFDKGYQAAFTMLEYNEPDFEKDKYIKWYKEGFDSNKEVEKIEEMAYNMGVSGKKLVIPEKYIASKEIFNLHYKEGAEAYKDEQQMENAQTVGGIAVILASWLARRFYVAKKMVA